MKRMVRVVHHLVRHSSFYNQLQAVFLTVLPALTWGEWAPWSCDGEDAECWSELLKCSSLALPLVWSSFTLKPVIFFTRLSHQCASGFFPTFCTPCTLVFFFNSFWTVSLPEGFPFDVQQLLQVPGDPGFVIGEAHYCPCGNNTLHTEGYVIRHTIGEGIDIISIWVHSSLWIQSSPTVHRKSVQWEP